MIVSKVIQYLRFYFVKHLCTNFAQNVAVQLQIQRSFPSFGFCELVIIDRQEFPREREIQKIRSCSSKCLNIF